MKMPIQWHEKNLSNTKDHAARLVKAHAVMDAEIARIFADIARAEWQIAEAYERKKLSFDADRFGFSKKKP